HNVQENLRGQRMGCANKACRHVFVVGEPVPTPTPTVLNSYETPPAIRNPPATSTPTNNGTPTPTTPTPPPLPTLPPAPKTEKFPGSDKAGEYQLLEKFCRTLGQMSNNGIALDLRLIELEKYLKSDDGRADPVTKRYPDIGKVVIAAVKSFAEAVIPAKDDAA